MVKGVIPSHGRFEVLVQERSQLPPELHANLGVIFTCLLCIVSYINTTKKELVLQLEVRRSINFLLDSIVISFAIVF